jgi:WD40 repeat protein
VLLKVVLVYAWRRGPPRGRCNLWDVATGQEAARLEGHDQDAVDVAFCPDGSLLATAGLDGSVRLWDVATRSVRAVLSGHTDKLQG